MPILNKIMWTLIFILWFIISGLYWDIVIGINVFIISLLPKNLLSKVDSDWGDIIFFSAVISFIVGNIMLAHQLPAMHFFYGPFVFGGPVLIYDVYDYFGGKR